MFDVLRVLTVKLPIFNEYLNITDVDNKEFSGIMKTRVHGNYFLKVDICFFKKKKFRGQSV